MPEKNWRLIRFVASQVGAENSFVLALRIAYQELDKRLMEQSSPPVPLETDKKEQIRKWFYDHRSQLQQCEEQMMDQYTKAIMTLSGGAIAVSLTFAKDFVAPSKVIHPGYLLFAWICWTATLVIATLGFYLSHWAARACRKEWDTYCNDLDKNPRTAGKRMIAFNVVAAAVAGILFFIGLCCTIAFVNSNLVYGR